MRLRRTPRARQAGPLAARLAGLCALGAGLALTACQDTLDPKPVDTTNTVPIATKVGDLLPINTQANSACGSITTRTGRVMAVSNRAIVVADTGNPAGGFTDAEYASVGATFDTLVYPVDTRAFGAPEDIDNNGRVIIFYTRSVNELTPRNVQYVIGGFFISRDLFPKVGTSGFQGCAGSNQGELFYLLVPDPSGTINGNVRTKANVLTTSVSTVAHEFQHLINASRRLFVLDQTDYYEQVWLNEGLSHIAEEINFYQSAGLSPSGQPGQSPRSNLGSSAFTGGSRAINALNAYNVSNLSRLSAYYKAVQDSTPLGLIFEGNDPADDGLATRGAVWAFLRYAADRLNGDDAAFFYKLVNGDTLGLPNLRRGTGAGTALEDWFRDWAVANYADGAVAPALDARFQYASWDFRSLLPRLSGNNNAYPLAVRALSNGVAQTDTVTGGSAAYYTFSLAAGASATVRTRTAAGAAPGANVRLSLVRVTAPDVSGGPTVTTYGAGQGADITVTNPSGAAAQYALVAFNANLANPRARESVAVTVTGAGAAVLAGSALTRADRQAAAQPGPTIAGLRAAEDGGALVVTDAPLQGRFRDMARRELAPRAAGAQDWFRSRSRQ